jgi:hypothetical protein
MANSKRRTAYNYWVRKYKPIVDKDDSPVQYDHCVPQEWALIQQAHEEHRLWTVVNEGNTWDICSGMAFVNRMYYIITEVPHNVNKFDIIGKY